ncbi:uncharacterized protein LOC115448204 isoform X2 [Manduca sexta]|nr:uncharacterized protein LOC115448204 isoform X2 [Manduca sexta]KAG6457476.1 hypothetical protein O3G_MSEX010334 [Manduca sexta]KAG6457477.1 hypothetical protein O3G_MSEX010334 [Manduca sexta]
MKGKKILDRNKEIKVLFASEVSRLTKRDRNVYCSTKLRNTKVGTLRKKSNSCYDVFGFQNRKCSYDHTTKQYRCDKGCITKKFSKLQSRLNKIHKLSQPKTEPKSVIEHQSVKILKPSKIRDVKSESDCCVCTRAQHYNLVCFPDNNHSTFRGKPIVNPKNIPKYPSAYFPDCNCVNQQVSVTPSRLQVRKKNVGDAAVATSRSLCNTCTSMKPTRAKRASGPFCRICKIPKSIRKRDVPCHSLGATKKIFSNHTSSRNLQNKIRTIFKCILLGLVVIAWSPCIITVLLCWILTYPLRPQYIKTSGCENEECLHKQTPLCHIMGGVKCLGDKAAYSIKAMLSLLRSNEEDEHLQDRPASYSRGCPDPKKKYTLFYTDHRGWRMKPIRDKNLHLYNGDVEEFQDPNSMPGQNTGRKKNIIKKCCGCKLRKAEKDINIDTTLHHPETKKNQSQNTKMRKHVYRRSQRLNGEGKSLKHEVHRPRIRSKSHPMPYDSHIRPCEKLPVKYPPCLRNSRSSPLPLNNNIAKRKCKSRFTQRLPNCCELCERRKQNNISLKEVNRSCHNKKVHPRCVSNKHRKKEKSYLKRLWNYIRCSWDELERVVDETEDVAWKDEIKCDMYWLTLQQKQFPWLYQHCPCLYPCFTVWFNCIKSTWHMAVYTLSFCVWCPVMFGCYIFSELFWQCLK